MVDKPKFVVSPHPKPCIIQWFNEGKGLQISHNVSSLSIEKTYKHEIWCDIVSMDACHIPLDRPWLSDKRAVHDGRMNTYTFTKYHKKITLTPCKSAHLSKTKGDPQMDIFLTTLLQFQLRKFESYKERILLG